MDELTFHLYVIRFQVAMPVSEHLTRLILLFHVQIKYMSLKENNSQSIYASFDGIAYERIQVTILGAAVTALLLFR